MVKLQFCFFIFKKLVLLSTKHFKKWIVNISKLEDKRRYIVEVVLKCPEILIISSFKKWNLTALPLSVGYIFSDSHLIHRMWISSQDVN